MPAAEAAGVGKAGAKVRSGAGRMGSLTAGRAGRLLCLSKLRGEGAALGGTALPTDVVPKVWHANDTILSFKCSLVFVRRRYSHAV